MKRTLLAFVLGGAALCASTAALAHIDVGVSIGVRHRSTLHRPLCTFRRRRWSINPRRSMLRHRSMLRPRSWWAAAITAIRTGASANGAATNGASANGIITAAGTVTDAHGTPQPD